MKNLLQLTVLCIYLLALRAAATTYYVDINSANPTPPYTSWRTAATNIQDAVGEANSGDTVLVTNGTYQTGGSVIPYGASLNRVAITKPLTVISVNGPKETTILGYVYPYYPEGARCAYVTNGGILSGFTLASGNVKFGTNDLDDYDFDGGGVYAESGGIISNCIVNGNTAAYGGGGAYGGLLINCVISGNSVQPISGATPAGGGAAESGLVNCVLSRNFAFQGGATWGCALTNCTVVTNSAVQEAGGVGGSTVVNSILYLNTDPGGTDNTNNPSFVNIENNDYHLQANSPCINAGNNAYVTTPSDLDGNPRIVGGIVDLGAYEYQAATIAISAQPANQTNILGQMGTLSIDAISPYPLSYQWLFDSNSIVGATNSSLVISNLQITDTGYYSVAISNLFFATNSSVALLSVFYPPPTIVEQPTNLAVILSSNAMLSVTATSYLNMTFQWQLNGTNLNDKGEFFGSTSSNLFISGAEVADAGDYDVIVSDSEWSVTSAVVTVTMFSPATITLQPTNETAVVPNNVSFSAAASGTGPLGFQWFFNGTPLTDGGNISGSASSNLDISGVQLTNAGVYQLLVTNSFSQAFSTTATLTVFAPIQILTEPTNEAVLIGNSATLSVTAAGTEPNYQWYFNGEPLSDGGRISGSATPNLTIANVQSSDGGNYQVMVSNPANSAASTTATLTPLESPGPSIRYVNASNSTPVSPYLAWSTAATNIQNAIDASINGDTIIVTDGIYRVGGETVNGSSLTNRVVINKNIIVESVNGPANTVIEGNQLPTPTIYSGVPSYPNYPLPVTPDGPGAVRCVCITTNATLIGFTLTGGATLYEPPNANDGDGGAVWCASTNYDVISNCVITANGAYNQGGGIFQGTLDDCTVLANSAMTGGGVANATIYSSLIISNTATSLNSSSSDGDGGGTFECALFSSAITRNYAENYGGGAYGGSVVNCTVTENTAVAFQGGGIASCAATNSIIYYNQILYPSISTNNWVSGELNYCCTTPVYYGPGNITNDPALANISHISLNSPCKGAGNPLATSGVDIDGNPWASPPSIGCSEIPPGGDYGNLIANISTPFTNWAPEYPLSFQATISGPCYTTVWNFGDGTIVTNAPYLSHVWSSVGNYPVTLTAYNDSYPTGVTATLMINIAVPTTYYVNWANLNPVPPYLSWSTAATNIQNAISVATPGSLVLVTNPTVIIWKGEQSYVTSSVAFYGGAQETPSVPYRVAITNPITVESVNGPATTFIQGAYGSGCVYMTNGAVLSGFTLTNGYYDYVPDALYAASTNAIVTNCIIINCQYGGAYSGTFHNCSFFGNKNGASVMSTLNNCVISNNTSQFGGGALGGILNGCLIVSNTAQYGGGAFGGKMPGGTTYPLLLNDCVISNNTAQYGGGVSGYGLTDPNFTNCIVTNCVLANNVAGSSLGAYGGAAFDAQLNNCLIVSNKSLADGGGVAGGLLNNCVVIGNAAASSGGGASPDNRMPGGNATISNCTLEGNSARFGGGGAYDCIVNASQVLTNEADYGGGYYGDGFSGALTNCLLAGNAANNGGGVDGDYESDVPPQHTILYNCTLSANFATNTGGGAIQCTLAHCTVMDNLSDYAGGGAAHAILNGCTIASNTALALVAGSPISGGGGADACTMTNCLLIQNFATTNGGGALLSTLINCTVAANTAAIGGGIFDCTAENCILYYNAGGDYYPSAPPYLLNYCCTALAPTNGFRNITTPPFFANLAGGDFHLQSSSPCINSGNNAYVKSATDLDGNPRIVGGTVDIGAYEYQTPTSVISYAYLQQYGLPTDGSVDFRDLDGTAFNVYQDWIAGLNPTNPASVLAMLTPAATNNATGVTVTWQSVSGIPYLLQRSTNLTTQPPFSTIQNITGQSGTTSYTDASATNNVPYFYRVGVVAP